MQADAKDNDLTPRQIKALGVLADGKSCTEAAKAAGVNAATVYRWITHDPAFGAALRRMEGDLLQTLGRRLALMGESVGKALEDGLDPKQTITVRLRAADIVLSRLLALAELAQVIQRVEALEAKLGAAGDETEPA